MRSIRVIYLSLAAGLLFVMGCGGGSSAASQAPSPTPVVKNIYALGDANPGSGIGHVYADTVWKNGVVVWSLPINASGWALGVSGSDVYVAGGIYNPTTSTTTYVNWKNGVVTTTLTPLPNQYIYALATSGNDVYAVGDANPGSGIGHVTAGTVWKNGVALWSLPSNADGWAIAVSGNDVYVAGDIYNPTTSTTTYVNWKNGVVTTTLTPLPNQYIYALATSGNDVYAVGDANPGSGIGHVTAGTVWKNGVALWSLPSNADGWALGVSGSDVYVAGGIYNPTTSTTTYVNWKNGVVTTTLTPLPNQYIYAFATSGN